MRRRSRRTTPISILILLAILAALGYLQVEQQPEERKEVAKQFTGKCVGVTDGDTIKVMYQGQEVKVRLNGVDSPESGQPFGSSAKQFTSKKVFGKTVTVDVVDRDRYGRIVGWVTTPEGKSLNAELVEAGMAWWYREYAPDDRLLETLEIKARTAKRGLWSRKNPVPPWEYRRKKAAGGSQVAV